MNTETLAKRMKHPEVSQQPNHPQENQRTMKPTTTPQQPQEATQKTYWEQCKGSMEENPWKTFLFGTLIVAGLLDAYTGIDIPVIDFKPEANAEESKGATQPPATTPDRGNGNNNAPSFNEVHPSNLTFIVRSVKKSTSGKAVFFNANSDYQQGYRVTAFTSDHPNLAGLTEAQISAMYLNRSVTFTGKPDSYKGYQQLVAKSITLN